MESLPNDFILKFHPDTLQAVRKLHDLDKPGEMATAVDIFEAWIKQQLHFIKKDFDRTYLERLIITCKGSVERAKQRLDKICTLRTLMPHYFGDYDVKMDFKNCQEAFHFAPLPTMGDRYERIFFTKNCGKYFDTEIFLNAYRNIAMLIEYFKIHDYADSCRFIVDMREVNMTELVTKIGLVECRQIVTLITDGYGLRLKGIHFLTSSKLIDTFVSIMKSVMSEKLGNRISVHKTVESLYEICPKEILPKEYGGEEPTLLDLREKWNDILSKDEFRQQWRELCSARTNESYRQTDKFNAQYMGMPGTFRTLSVD